MAKILLFYVPLFFVSDFLYYLYLKKVKGEYYKNYIDYIKKQVK